MKISVFTPFHRADYVGGDRLFRAYESLLSQYRKPDEWVVLLNGPALLEPMRSDLFPNWVRFVKSDNHGNIGALKNEACQACTGDILVELDYDDELTLGAIETIEAIFQGDENLACVYSAAVEVRPDGTHNLYGGQYGWEVDAGTVSTHAGPISAVWNVPFRPSAQYFRRIEWAPNHVRAFRATAYHAVGGHDSNLPVGDDHDLICRLYREHGAAGFAVVKEPLYIYHIHDDNTCNGRNRNAEIQAVVDRNYCVHAEKMYLRWATDNGLRCLDLGGRIGSPEGYESVDLLDADVIADLNAPWPFEDDSVGVIRAYHVLEHLDDPIHFFNEAYRVLSPGGFLLIEVPSAEGAGAFGDPTHKKFFNLLSFEYFTNQQYARFIQPAYTGRFQKARVVQYWWDNPKIPVISAQLIALKGWYEDNWCGAKEM